MGTDILSTTTSSPGSLLCQAPLPHPKVISRVVTVAMLRPAAYTIDLGQILFNDTRGQAIRDADTDRKAQACSDEKFYSKKPKEKYSLSKMSPVRYR